MEIRGHQYTSAQGIATVSNTTPVEIIAGVAGKTLYLNYISISISDAVAGSGELTDGSGGTAFWKQELIGTALDGPSSYMLNYGEYGLALTEGNSLYGTTTDAGLDYTVTALGYYK